MIVSPNEYTPFFILKVHVKANNLTIGRQAFFFYGDALVKGCAMKHDRSSYQDTAW
jgi:hypothetical protein